MTKADELRAELNQLVHVGHMLYARERIAMSTKEEREVIASRYKSDEKPSKTKTTKSESASELGDTKLDRDIKYLFTPPDFGREYQAWFTSAVRVIHQLLPDRESEFRSLYRTERRNSKLPDVESYSVADYIAGITVTSGFTGAPSFNILAVAMKRVEQQVDILRSASSRLDLQIADIEGVLHASVLDNEIDAARGLLRANHIRSAGVIAGVALEGHLKRLLADHGISMRKTPVLSNLNEALKDAGVYGVPQWRQIQFLTDLRNLCGHKADRDPERSEITDMVEQVDKIIKTVF